MGEDQLDGLDLTGLIILRILDGIPWDFTQGEMMDVMENREEWQLYLDSCPRNFHGKASNEKEEKYENIS